MGEDRLRRSAHLVRTWAIPPIDRPAAGREAVGPGEIDGPHADGPHQDLVILFTSVDHDLEAPGSPRHRERRHPAGVLRLHEHPEDSTHTEQVPPTAAVAATRWTAGRRGSRHLPRRAGRHTTSRNRSPGRPDGAAARQATRIELGLLLATDGLRPTARDRARPPTRSTTAVTRRLRMAATTDLGQHAHVRREARDLERIVARVDQLCAPARGVSVDQQAGARRRPHVVNRPRSRSCTSSRHARAPRRYLDEQGGALEKGRCRAFATS